jgi:hypothetical protein
MRIIRANVRPGISWGEEGNELSCNGRRRPTMFQFTMERKPASCTRVAPADQRHLHGHRNDHLRGANVRLCAVCRVPLRPPATLPPRNKLEESTHRWPLSGRNTSGTKGIPCFLPGRSQSLWKWTDSIHRVQHTGAITDSMEPTTNQPGTNLCLHSLVCPLLKLVGPLCSSAGERRQSKKAKLQKNTSSPSFGATVCAHADGSGPTIFCWRYCTSRYCNIDSSYERRHKSHMHKIHH